MTTKYYSIVARYSFIFERISDNNKQVSMDISTTPRKIVTYPIGSVPKAGAVFLFGKTEAPRLVLMCAGYPDDHTNFLPFASRLAVEADCLVGVTCLPGYDDRDDHRYTDNPVDGYSFQDMVTAIREAVYILRAESTVDSAKLIGIFHDWGVLSGSMHTNHMLEVADNQFLTPDRIVLLDVLGPPHPDTEKQNTIPIDARRDTMYETVVTLSYRIVLAKAFAIRRYISKTLAQIYAGFAFTALGLLRMSPTMDIDAQALKQQRKVPLSLDRMLYMAYPYFNAFKATLKGTIQQEFRGMHLPKDLCKTPVLYMYGTEKRIMFHDRRALKMLEEEQEKGRSKSKAVKVEGAGHWLYLQQQDLCLKEVKQFVMDA